MTNRGTARRMNIQRMIKQEKEDTWGRTKITWLDPHVDRIHPYIPHSVRHPNDKSKIIHLVRVYKDRPEAFEAFTRSNPELGKEVEAMMGVKKDVEEIVIGGYLVEKSADPLKEGDIILTVKEMLS